jgi:nitrite reductase/ring-hydroxylating ferredoxin subunit/uncharacterized membrane protein
MSDIAGPQDSPTGEDRVSSQGDTHAEAAVDASPERAPFLDRLSDGLAGAVGAIVGSQRKPPRRLKSFLNGTWFGHPLHPSIVEVPIGVWLLAAVFDIIWLAVPGASVWAARAAEGAIIAGIVAALGAVATGLTDWSDTYGGERRTGLYHGSLMLLAFVLYVVSIILRLNDPAGDDPVAAILGFAGIAIVLFAAYLGGSLVFGHGTGVNHAAWEAGTEDFVPVAALADLPENALSRGTAAGVPVVMLRMGERVYAISATCPHAGGPLDEGALQGDVVECPWHGSRFNMRTGRVLTGPATMNAPRYETRVRDGQVEVKRVGGH